MIKTIFLALLGLLVVAALVLSLIALQRPATFSVARSVVIAAPAEKIFPLINDVHAFNSWNPYQQRDPAMQGRYSGPASGAGAHYDFESKKSGSGSFEITQALAPSLVRMRLIMSAPFKADNSIRFTLVPQEAQTRVTWTMQGPANFLSRLIGVVVDMDNMIGQDFAQGLASLKSQAEAAI